MAERDREHRDRTGGTAADAARRSGRDEAGKRPGARTGGAGDGTQEDGAQGAGVLEVGAPGAGARGRGAKAAASARAKNSAAGARTGGSGAAGGRGSGTAADREGSAPRGAGAGGSGPKRTGPGGDGPDEPAPGGARGGGDRDGADHGWAVRGGAPSGGDLTGVLTAVGPRLRALRRERGVTLAQLGEATGISLSTLSRLESGQRKPTLELLLPLARAHRVALDELVGAPPTGDPRVHARPFTRFGMTFIPLTRDLQGLAAYKQIIPPGFGGSGELERRVHEGYEWCYVLAGRLRLLLGDNDLLLTAGEAAEFDTRIPHALANPGPEPVELLNIFGKQGERMHVRARPAARG